MFRMTFLYHGVFWLWYILTASKVKFLNIFFCSQCFLCHIQENFPHSKITMVLSWKHFIVLPFTVNSTWHTELLFMVCSRSFNFILFHITTQLSQHYSLKTDISPTDLQSHLNHKSCGSHFLSSLFCLTGLLILLPLTQYLYSIAL